MSIEFTDNSPPHPNRWLRGIAAVVLVALAVGGSLIASWGMRPDETSTIANARGALVRQQPTSARASLQRLLAFEPKHAETLFLLGACWQAEGRLADAISVWNSIPEESRWSLEAQPLLGYALLGDARLNDAERTFSAYLRRVPEADDVRDELHWLFFNQFRTRELEQFLESQLERFPAHHSVLMHLLYSEMRPPQPREGLAYLEEIEQRRPNQVTVLRGLGYCYWQIGRIDEAQHRLQEALASDPQNRECLLTAASFCVDQRAFDEARKLLNLLAKQTDQNVELDDRLFVLESQINEAEGHWEQALENVNRALRQRPNEVAYLQRCGTLRQKLGQADDAQEKFREAHRLETIQTKLLAFVFQGDLEHPTRETCQAAAELCEARGRRAQARGWRLLEAKLSERLPSRLKAGNR